MKNSFRGSDVKAGFSQMTGLPGGYTAGNHDLYHLLAPVEIYGFRTARPSRRASNDSQYTFVYDQPLPPRQTPKLRIPGLADP